MVYSGSGRGLKAEGAGAIESPPPRTVKAGGKGPYTSLTGRSRSPRVEAKALHRHPGNVQFVPFDEGHKSAGPEGIGER